MKKSIDRLNILLVNVYELYNQSKVVAVNVAAKGTSWSIPWKEIAIGTGVAVVSVLVFTLVINISICVIVLAGFKELRIMGQRQVLEGQQNLATNTNVEGVSNALTTKYI